MKICLVLDTNKQSAINCSQNIIDLFVANNVTVLMCKGEARAIGRHSDKVAVYDSYKQIFDICDYAVTVGGDGMIIHIARYAAPKGVPLLGVNVGRVGFVAGIEPFEYTKLAKLCTGDFTLEDRMLLSATISKPDGVMTYYAVNEAVISRGSLSKIIDYDVLFDGEQVATYRADGLIFATPTGSTAYSLSAGGPIVEPTMNCILLTPICPYSLTSRCVVLDSNSVLSVKSHTTRNAQCFLTIDGVNSIEILKSDIVKIAQAPFKLKLINLENKNFFKVIDDKF